MSGKCKAPSTHLGVLDFFKVRSNVLRAIFRQMLSELVNIFGAYKDIEECNSVAESFNILATHLAVAGFELFGVATLQAVAQITIKLLHHLKEDDIERVLLLLLKHGLLTREILIYLLSNTTASLISLLYNHISLVQQLKPHQQALLLKYAVLSHKCDQPQLDEDLFRAVSLLFIGGCTVGPYATLRNLFLSGMCNHKTRYGDCLGSRLIDECVAAETSRGVHSRNIITKLTENYFFNTHDKQQDRSILDSMYFLLKDADHEGMWKDIARLPPVSMYMDLRSQDNFHRHLHLRFMQNELSTYVLACSISHCKDVPEVISQVFSNTFTLLPSDLARSAVVQLITNSTDSLLETDLDVAQSLGKLFPGLPATLLGEPEIKKPVLAKLGQDDEGLPSEDEKQLITETGICFTEHYDEKGYDTLLESIADASFKQFTSSYHYNYLFIAGSLRGLDTRFLDEAAAFIYNS
ncbi:putative iron-sulfur cluster scaffold family related protein [Giardia duodenalis assemblage B]|uniref:Putative iron-sulfur cluster scaffold family related protein n=1 Tax=Giardia duodenalis assemblage B TaxID=1394984 RepID=A0A132NRZ4_GIAIN|nr:putative iron-sulfur cluster scaffold family related protein [Giardia intestinalis assemblage B]